MCVQGISNSSENELNKDEKQWHVYQVEEILKKCIGTFLGQNVKQCYKCTYTYVCIVNIGTFIHLTIMDYMYVLLSNLNPRI